jgi:hypothetical protein
MGIFMVVLHPIYEDGHIKEVYISGAGGTYGKKKFVQRFGSET